MRKFFLLLSLLCSLYVFPQQEKDVKVGLVLSGGGAKGLAHIGALKVIEEAGVRIDYIGGTSMGAIIGSLYASGYTVEQLDSIFTNTNFSTLIQDDIPRGSKTFYEKQESEKYAIILPFDKFKVGIPSGISKGQNIFNLLSRLTSHVSDIHDFSKLPIPFFCVATDVETGEEVILDHGYLPQAVSASGALPSIFRPVVVDGKVLIDGGVVNNYPVDLVRKKGMDVIIGVDVQDSLKSRDDLRSAFQVLVQINNFKSISEMVEKREKTDIYIHPDIKGYGVMSFDLGRKIIESGEESASNYFNELEAIAQKQSKKERKPVVIKRRDTLIIDDVEVEGNKKYTRSYVLGKLKLRAPTKVTYPVFSEGINNLAATGNFQSITYKFAKDSLGENKLYLRVRENNSQMFLRLGAHYDNLFQTAALVNIMRKRVITNNDIVSLDLIVGDNLRYNFDYYIDKGYYWSLGLSSKYHFFEVGAPLSFIDVDFPVDVPLSINKLSIKYSDFTNQIYFQTPFRRTFILGAGGEHKYLRYLSETISGESSNLPRTIFESTNYVSVFGYLKYDTYDNSFFPKTGAYFSGDFHWYLWSKGLNSDIKPFSIAKARLGYAHTFFKKLTLHATTEGGFKLGGETASTLDFALGGYGFKEMNNIIPFLGYEPLSIRGNTYLKSTLTIDYEFIRKNHINLGANIANVGNDLFERGKWIDAIGHTGYFIGYGMETILGPLEVKYAYTPETRDNVWYVALGYRF